MGNWTTSKTIRSVLMGLGVWFALMAGITYVTGGERLVHFKLPEQKFEKERFEDPHATFRLEEESLVQLTVEGTTLDNSWVWAKVVLADRNDRPVADYTFDLSYYSGDDWSEGDPEDYRVFKLPPGTYKLIVHGEDAKRNSGWTRVSRERLEVSVHKDVKLARYPLAGMIVCFLSLFGYQFFSKN